MLSSEEVKVKSFLAIVVIFLLACTSTTTFAYVVDHNSTDLGSIPESAINQAKNTLHIAYGHTSHGSQLITGMTGLDGQTNLVGYKGDIYQWNEGGSDGALDIDDYFVGGDLGHNGSTTWADSTRTYLDNPANSDVNVVIWSWCGGCSDNTPTGIQIYLDTMNQLETDYPNVTFVYMTGHADAWNDDTVKTNNSQIRNYCIANNKILYDFFDIESYNPDNHYFEYVGDNCNYYNDTIQIQGNWATEWQNTHTEGVDWYQCTSAHSEPLNANRKAYAAWWLWARIAGWDGGVGADTEDPTIPQNLDATTISSTQVDLSWEDSSDNIDVTGYNVYYKQGNTNFPLDGTSIPESPSPIDVDDTITTSINGLTRDTVYYFAVTAYDAARNESLYSNIVSNQWMPALLTPLNGALDISTVSARFQWSTASAINATYTLYYSTDSDFEAIFVPSRSKTQLPWDGTIPVAPTLFALSFLLLWFVPKTRIRDRYIFLTLGATLVLAACGGGGSSSPDGGSHSTATVYSVDKGNSSYHETSDLDIGTTYYWRVIATDTADSSVTYTSETYHFTTESL